MKFDLEAAKRGDPIECLEAYGWLEVKFIGPWDAGSVVCAVDWSYKPEIVLMSKLRMAGKKEILFYRVAAMLSEGSFYVITALTGKHVTAIEEDKNFFDWIHKDWEMVEVTNRSAA